MKLCMVNGYFHPFVGGTERHMLELGKRMARTEDVSVITTQLENTPTYEELDGIKVHRLPTRHYRMPIVYPPPLPITRGVGSKIAELDRKHNYDAFNLHGRWFRNFNEVVSYANKKKKLMVLTLHNARPLGITKTIALIGMAYEGLQGKEVIRNSNSLISVSEALKRDIMEYGIEGDKIKVIYNGVDTGHYKPSESSFREEYADGFDNLLLFVGRIIEQKGLDYLIDAMPAILKEHPRTRILITGKGKLVPRLRDRIKSKGLENHMVFPGFIDGARLPELYSSADLFVLPSLWETFGFVLVEAGACGVPLCGSDAGGIPEVISHGQNGIVFKKGSAKEISDSVISMLDDPEMLRDMGRKSRQIACEKFDWEIINKQTLAHYEEIISDFY